VGGGASVRLFANRDFSLEPFAEGVYQNGSGDAGSFSAKFTLVSFLAGFSISGWLGEPRAAETAPAPPPWDDIDQPPPPEDAAHADVDIYAAGPAPKVAEDGTVKIEIPLVGGGTLHLSGKPADDPVAATLELSVPEGRERLANCAELALETGEATTPLEAVEHAEKEQGTAAVLRGKAKIATLSDFANASQSALVFCEDGVKLDSRQRRFVARFVDALRAQAK
jgi:hypothetical protein